MICFLYLVLDILMKEGKIPTVHELPKGDPVRDRVARQIMNARRVDRATTDRLSDKQRMQEDLAAISEGREPKKRWVNDRMGRDYVSYLKGLEATFQYIRGLESNLVLDIGTGTSQGIADIARSDLGKGLQFKGTSVTPLPEFNQYLGNDQVIITSAESLRGVESSSVGGIIALHSISYAAEPQYMVARLDQVLVDGGVVKMVTDDNDNSNRGLGERTREWFIDAFKKIGYDVAVYEDVVLAIKRSGDKSTSTIRARSLIRQDMESAYQWHMKLQPEIE